MTVKDERDYLAKMNWGETLKRFEKEMFDKLEGLPGHQEVSEDLREFRSIISHELPETAPKDTYRFLIKLLLENKRIDTNKAREKYLRPELKREQRVISGNKDEFEKLKKDAWDWVKKNLPEKKLQKMWKAHETWLPRRYTICKNPNLPFQIIAADTLARYYLIKNLSNPKDFLGKEVEVIMDRPLGSKHPKHGFEYMANYGYLPNTRSPDGEELDAYYLGVDKPLKKAKGICIAVIHRTNDNDDKLVVVPKGVKLTNTEIEKQIYFQEQWFKHTIIRK